MFLNIGFSFKPVRLLVLSIAKKVLNILERRNDATSNPGSGVSTRVAACTEVVLTLVDHDRTADDLNCKTFYGRSFG
jgi:hypothetical protein